VSNNDKKEFEEIIEQIKSTLTDVNLDDVSINIFVKNKKKCSDEAYRYNFNLADEFRTGKSNDSCGSSKKQSFCKGDAEEFTAIENKILDVARNVALMTAADIRQYVNVFIQELAQSCSTAFKKMNEYNCNKDKTNYEQ
jgi:hypothetical protein